MVCNLVIRSNRRFLQRLICGALLAAFLPAAHAAGTAGTWQPIPPGGSRVQALASTAGSAVVYAGTACGGVFRTPDRGATWQASNSGLQGFDVVALALAPGGAPLYAATGSGMFRSEDGATSWQATSFPGTATAMAMAPGAPSTLYATGNTAIYRSDDGGETWNKVLPVDFLPAALAIDAGSPQHVYMAYANDNKVLISRTGGATWRTVALATDGILLGLTADPAYPGTAYAATSTAIFVTHNGGGNWAQVPGLPTGTYPGTYMAVGFAAGAPGILGAAVDKARGRLWRSTDDGATWTFLYAGDPVSAIIGDPLRPQRAYVASSPDGILHGTFLPGNAAPQLGTLDASAVRTLAVDTQRSSTLYAYGLLAPSSQTSSSALDLPPGSLRASTDSGTTWQAGAGVPSQGVLSLFAAPAGTTSLGGAYALAVAGAQGSPLLHTSDGGASWQTLSTLKSTAFAAAAAPSAPLVLYGTGYVYTPNSKGCPEGCQPYAAISTDGGITWSYQNFDTNPPLVLTTTNTTGWLVRVAPGDAQTAYFGLPGVLMKTVDGGKTVTQAFPTPAASALIALLDLAIDPQQPNHLYGVMQDGTLNTSVDGGQTWAPLGTGLPQGSVRGIVASPAGGGISQPLPLYAATAQGVYASFDSGATWAILGSGLANTSVLTVSVDPNRGTVFAGVEGAGGLFVLVPAAP
jgi:photosystem II stability/assembly factor-like uncharacterized protein